MTVIFTRSRPETGLLSLLSGIATPALRTRTEFSGTDVVLFPIATIAEKLASMIMKNKMEQTMIPVIVARVYFKKDFICSIDLKMRPKVIKSLSIGEYSPWN